MKSNVQIKLKKAVVYLFSTTACESQSDALIEKNIKNRVKNPF